MPPGKTLPSIHKCVVAVQKREAGAEVPLPAYGRDPVLNKGAAALRSIVPVPGEDRGFSRVQSLEQGPEGSFVEVNDG